MSSKSSKVEEALRSSILVVHKAAAVPLSLSFLNGLLNHVGKVLNVDEALKSSILVLQKAAGVHLSWSFLNGLLNHVRDPYYRWQAGSTLPCSKIDIVNTAEYLELHQSNLNLKKKEKKSEGSPLSLAMCSAF